MVFRDFLFTLGSGVLLALFCNWFANKVEQEAASPIVAHYPDDNDSDAEEEEDNVSILSSLPRTLDRATQTENANDDVQCTSVGTQTSTKTKTADESKCRVQLVLHRWRWAVSQIRLHQKGEKLRRSEATRTRREQVLTQSYARLTACERLRKHLAQRLSEKNKPKVSEAAFSEVAAPSQDKNDVREVAHRSTQTESGKAISVEECNLSSYDTLESDDAKARKAIAGLREQDAKAELEIDAARNRDHDRQAELEAMGRISEEAQNAAETATNQVQASCETILETEKQRRDLQRQLDHAKKHGEKQDAARKEYKERVDELRKQLKTANEQLCGHRNLCEQQLEQLEKVKDVLLQRVKNNNQVHRNSAECQAMATVIQEKGEGSQALQSAKDALQQSDASLDAINAELKNARSSIESLTQVRFNLTQQLELSRKAADDERQQALTELERLDSLGQSVEIRMNQTLDVIRHLMHESPEIRSYLLQRIG